MSELFSVLAIDGGVMEWAEDATTPYLRYDGLTWTEAVELCRISFKNGFRCVIWLADGGENTGGADDAEKESGREM